jgi:GNAT superfamily N-acetyltransferase
MTVKRFEGTPAVRVLTPGDAGAVIDVFCDAFAQYPVMRHVLGETASGDRSRLETLIRFFVSARVLRGEPMLGIEMGGTLAAAATTSFSDGPASPPEFATLREETWRALGDEARDRYAACVKAWGPLGVDVPNVHLNMIGVRALARGTGLARELLDAVLELSRRRPGSQGVTLTTEDPANLALYEHCGFHVVGHARIVPNLESWGLFRAT